MGRSLACPLAALLAAALAPAAAAQGYGTHYNRPTAYAPSVVVGRTGGAYTGRYTTQTIATRDNRRQHDEVSLFLATQPRRRSAIGGHQAAPVRFGLIPAPARRALLRAGTLSENRIKLTSGFLHSVAVSKPLYGAASYLELPLPTTPLFDVATQGSEFHQFFNLVPGESASETREAVPFDNLMDAVEQETEAARQDTQEQALRLFWEATGGRRADGEPVPESKRPALLRRAARLFASVRDLAEEGEAADPADTDAYLPHLLLAHTYLERYRASGYHVGAAMNSLLTVARYDPEAFYRIAQARRDPQAFPETRDLAVYFGDCQDGYSRTLERQMRQYAAASARGRSLGALVLQAYCAWVLDDIPRARVALEQAERLLRDRPSSSRKARDWSTLVAALQYAL